MRKFTHFEHFINILICQVSKSAYSTKRIFALDDVCLLVSNKSILILNSTFYFLIKKKNLRIKNLD